MWDQSISIRLLPWEIIQVGEVTIDRKLAGDKVNINTLVLSLMQHESPSIFFQNQIWPDLM
jgi:hypothetical protein